MSYVIPFLLLTIAGAFEHEQALNARDFHGESQLFCTFMWLSVWSCKICSYGLLFYIGFNLSWVAAGVMYAAGFVAPGVLAGVLAAMFNRLVFSIAAFIVWPVCLIGAFLLLPKP